MTRAGRSCSWEGCRILRRSVGINPATFVGTGQNSGFVAPIECLLPNSRHNPAWVTNSHMKFFRFYATGTARLAYGTGPFLPVPCSGLRTRQCLRTQTRVPCLWGLSSGRSQVFWPNPDHSDLLLSFLSPDITKFVINYDGIRVMF